MRTLQCLMLAAAALFGSYAHAKVDVIPGRGHTIYQVNIDKVTFNDAVAGGKKFQQAKLVGVDGYEGILYVEGNPEVPVVRLLIEGESSMVSVGGERKMALPKRGIPLKPVLASAPKIKGAKAVFKFNSKAYKANAFQPAREFDVQDAGSVRGKKRLMVTLYPIAYNPATGELQFRSYFEVKVTNKADNKRKNAQPMIAFVVGQQFADSPSVARYAEHKRALGFRVETIVVGRDATTDAEIRAKLQQLLAMSSAKLEHALLIGDAADVPGHASNIISGTTDLYYAAIDTADYESDLHAPDIGVGRFPAANEEQLAAMVDKGIAYQRGIFGQEAWLNSVSFLATDDRWELAEGTHNYAIETYTAPKGYVGMFPEANQVGGDRLYAVTHRAGNAEVMPSFHAGRTIIDYSGHGAGTFWDAPRVEQSHVRSLTADSSSLPFVISNACITGNFHVDESFAETWARHRYGAIVFWGSMDSTYWDEDDILEKRMFDGIYAQNKATFAEITNHALTEHYAFYGGGGRAKYYWETYHVFGDPSLQLRTTKTSAAVIEGPTEVPVGVYPIEYTIRDEAGRALANMSVALKANGNVIAVAKTNAEGMVAFSPAEDAAGPGTELAVVVSGQNLRETSFATTVISPNSAWLNLRDVRVNGRTELLVGANEQVQIAMNVANVGLVATQGATLAIESVQGPARVVTGNSGVQGLAPGAAQGLDGSQFVLHISPNAQRGEMVRVNFAWTTMEGTTGKVAKTFKIARASLNALGVRFVSVEGVRPGQSAGILVSVENSGTETMRNVVLNMSPDACLAGASGRVEIAELAPGAMAIATTESIVTVDAACRSGDTAKYRLDGMYEGFGGATSVGAVGQFTVGIIAVREIESANIGLAIPDAGSAVEHSLVVDGAGLISDVGLHVKITHPYIGDLTVSVVHPDGTEIMLHNQDGGSSSNLDAVFGLGGSSVADMARLAGKPMAGTWKVRVQDTASADVGSLEYVKLTLKGFMD